ncbi:MAG: FkbM family methyltransferase [Pseudomonadota bacterium]
MARLAEDANIEDHASDHAQTALAGLRRSFDTYYRDPARAQRMHALNARLVPPGAVVFDIGAHVGDRTGSFLRLGARVVALEPQPLLFRALRRLYGRCPKATLRAEAVGAKNGETDLYLNPSNPTIATTSAAFLAAADGAEGWEEETWTGQTRVPVTTLDALIETYGTPGFVKIDVEGHEPQVLAGLSTAIPLLSFEFTTIQRQAAQTCIDQLCSLGRYQFNFSLGEDHAMQLETWVDGGEMGRRIRELPHAANSGDAYARRV